MTVDVLLRYTTEDDFAAAMAILGVPYFPENRPLEQLGAISTEPLITHQGIVRMVRFHNQDDQVARLPDILSPTMLIDWRSDEEEWSSPTYTHDAVDVDGNTYVVHIEAGRIA